MDIKEVYELLAKQWDKIEFRYHENPKEHEYSYIMSCFQHKKTNIGFYVRTKLISDNLLLDFSFGKINNYNQAIYYVNEFNKNTASCYKAYINDNKDGDYFHITYAIGVNSLSEVDFRFNQALEEIVKKPIYQYISPLCAMLENEEQFKTMA